jgi:hypothetical protein
MIIILAETSLNNIYQYKYIIKNIFIISLNYREHFSPKSGETQLKYAVNPVQRLDSLPEVP